jgi:HPt (histidine-containing phosphotransfer) domain-containing protein
MRPAVDLDRLAELSDGTAEGLRSLVEIFLADVGETIDELTGAVAAGKRADIEQLAHRAGGASAACGAAPLAELLMALEAAAHTQQTPLPRSLMASVTEELARVTGLLRSHPAGRAKEP